MADRTPAGCTVRHVYRGDSVHHFLDEFRAWKIFLGKTAKASNFKRGERSGEALNTALPVIMMLHSTHLSASARARMRLSLVPHNLPKQVAVLNI